MPIMPSTRLFDPQLSHPIESPARPDSPETPTPLLLSALEAARLLNVSPRTVWSLTEAGSLPHVRIGRRVLYPVDALRRWTQAQTRTSQSSTT
jgi:excisionase family DNA binding protein